MVIRAGCINGVLEIEVRNTGHWSSDAGDADSGGVGLENLKNRLDLLYADRYRLQATEEAGWVSVTVAVADLPLTVPVMWATPAVVVVAELIARTMP